MFTNLKSSCVYIYLFIYMVLRPLLGFLLSSSHILSLSLKHCRLSWINTKLFGYLLNWTSECKVLLVFLKNIYNKESYILN